MKQVEKMFFHAALACAWAAVASPIGEALRPIAESGKVPGICTAVCDAKGEVTIDCIGYANIEKKTPITEETLFWVASDTKGIAGALVLTFIQEGTIDLDAPVEKYFPSWRTLYVREKKADGTFGERRLAKTKPTVRNLISHTAGIPFLPGGPIDTRSMALMANLVPTRDLLCEPNTKYNYSNWGIDCAVAIVELVSGKPWEVSLKERILDPLGMRSATFWPLEDDAPGAKLATAYDMSQKSPNYRKAVKTVNMRHPYTDPQRYAEAGGGLFMTTRDYMKFCRMILAGGKAPNGKVILTPESMRLLTTKQTPACEKTSYGFGFFWKPETGELSHGGAFNTGYGIDLSNHTAYVFHWQAPGGNEDTRKASGIFHAAKRKFLEAANKPSVTDAAYGNYGTVENLKIIPVDETIDATRTSRQSVPVATGAGTIVVCPPQAKGETIFAADYGFSVTNDDNGAAIERALAAAKRRGAGRLELTPGVYRCYGPRGIFIEGFEDFVLDGKGAELVFRRDPTYPIVPSWNHAPDRANFVIRNCRRMRIGGFDMDWDWHTAPLATGAIVTKVYVDEKRDCASYVEFELLGHGARHPYYGGLFPVQHLNRMSADFRRFGDRNGNWWMGTYEGEAGAKSEWIDPVRVRVYPAVYDPQTPHWGGPNAAGGNAKANRRMTSDMKVGESVRLAHRYYGKGGFTLDSNEDFVLHDVNVYACFGFGIYVDGSQRNWMLNNVTFKPRDLRHPISCSADTLHFSHSNGGAIIDGFYTSHGQDDSINVHDRFTVAKPTGPRELSVILQRGAVYFMPKVGHEVELRRPTFHATGWRGKVVAVDGARITFDREVPSGESFYLVFDRTSSCDRVIFRNAVIEDNEQRCLFNASDVTIENCVFRRTNGDAVRLLADYTMTYWCEGTGVTNLVVRGCRFENCCTGQQHDCPWNMGANLVTCLGLPPSVKVTDADKSFISRILVEDCTFKDSLSYAATFDFGSDILFRRNTIDETGARADRLPTAGSIRLRHVANACFEDNRFIVPEGMSKPTFRIGEDVSGLTLRRNRYQETKVK